ncbi:MAG: phosphoribosylanthranilate isomerase [Treponema sp.]|jgi:phosphoribosylanthranilate isomerase|nr:phosphoribosylanthranilate isomerase [Treponema sp.]
MRIKICGLFRGEDIDFVNEARPDYIGFVFAQSSRQVSAPLAQHLRFRLADGIVPVGVFVNAPIAMITELYHNGIISAAQLHGNEDDSYIVQLKKLSETRIREKKTQAIKVIKTVFPASTGSWLKSIPANADYILIDSGAGSGKTFDWKKLSSVKFKKPWFLAGGVSPKNIKEAMTLNPFAIDVSSGAETDGIKDREKILQLVKTVRQGNI